MQDLNFSVFSYENGLSQPTLDVIRKMAVALRVSADELVFDKDERGPDKELQLLFEAISNFPPRLRKRPWKSWKGSSLRTKPSAGLHDKPRTMPMKPSSPPANALLQKDKILKLNLIENAKESLLHAVDHLCKLESNPTSNIKRVILDVSHALELFIKEKIARIHSAFLWRDIDKYPSPKAITINTSEAINRLKNIGKVSLSSSQIKTIEWCREIRNNIEHFDFEIEKEKGKIVIGRMLALIFDFTSRYLDFNFESELKNDDTWKRLIDNYEFFMEYTQSLEKRLQDEKRDIIGCPICGCDTYDLNKKECMFCEFSGNEAKCDLCGKSFTDVSARRAYFCGEKIRNHLLMRVLGWGAWFFAQNL